MAGQQQHQPQRRDDEGAAPAPEPESGAAAQAQARERTEQVDDLLAEIDGVLETNAEEFVHSFVQKGGQ